MGYSALLDILGFPVSSVVLTHDLYNLTAYALEVDTVTHFADRDSKAQRTSALPSQAAGVAGTWLVTLDQCLSVPEGHAWP